MHYYTKFIGKLQGNIEYYRLLHTFFIIQIQAVLIKDLQAENKSHFNNGVNKKRDPAGSRFFNFISIIR